MHHNSVSIIIPAYHEHEILADTLENIYEVCGYEAEVIIIDQTPHDFKMTKKVIDRFHKLTYQHALGENRASSMNQGASMARGDILLFLHADTRLPEGALDMLSKIDIAKYPYGGFERFMEPTTLGTRLIDRVLNTWILRAGFFLGDNALFVEKQLFQIIGGFWSQPVYEDIDLSRRLKGRAKKNGQSWKVLTPAVRASSRKYMVGGVWKMMLVLGFHFLLYRFGYSVDKIAKMQGKI